MRLNRFLGLALPVVAVALFACAAVQGEQQSARTGANRVVSIDLKDTPIKQAIDSIFQGSGLKYYIRPGVAGKVVEMKLTGVTVEQAINALAEAAGLKVTVEDGSFVIAPEPRSMTSGSTVAQYSQPKAMPAPQGSESGAGPSARRAEQPAPPEPKGTSQTQGGNSASVVISQPPAPVYYGQTGPYSSPGAYSPYGGYSGGGYPPMYQFGNVSVIGGYSPVVVAGGNSSILNRGPLVPPPVGYVGPDLLRFLRTQWAIQNRTYLSYPNWGYPY